MSDEAKRAAELTRQGKFQDAIPLFLTALRGTPDDFAIKFNLALCYAFLLTSVKVPSPLLWYRMQRP